MASPTTITGLSPETEYNVSVMATFETGISQSPLITFTTGNNKNFLILIEISF